MYDKRSMIAKLSERKSLFYLGNIQKPIHNS
jgi:hypothetical protein